MKAKLNHSSLSGMVNIGHIEVSGVVSFAGGDGLLKQADELYAAGNEQDARSAVREALKLALQRLDAVHGTVEDEVGDLGVVRVRMGVVFGRCGGGHECRCTGGRR